MTKQLIFCVESDSRAKTDWIYISATIRTFFDFGNETKLTPIYLSGKMNYCKQNTVNKIKEKENRFNGESTVILSVDTDSIETDSQKKKEFETISNYCRANNYELIWFHRDIEDVYLGEQITNSSKRDRATHFARSNGISKVDRGRLNEKRDTAAHSSNILSVLEKHLKMK